MLNKEIKTMKKLVFIITVLSVFHLGAQDSNYLQGEVLVQLKKIAASNN